MIKNNCEKSKQRFKPEKDHTKILNFTPTFR